MNIGNFKNNSIEGFSINYERRVSAFRSSRDEKRYWFTLIALFLISGLIAYGLLVYNNPVPVNSPSFLPVVRRRMTALIAMAIAAICQSFATVTFQSATNNRIITPSLLGFEALYSAIQTGTMFFFGTTVFLQFTGTVPFLIQVTAMITMCFILYGWLLLGKYGDLQLMLLVGVIIGTGLRAMSAFMRRLLAPSEFDILRAKLFASVNNADSAYFPIAIPMVIITAGLLLFYAKKLNVISLGSSTSIALGVKHKFGLVYVLVLVAILMSVSTAMVGPLTFFGFLVAMLTYQMAPTYDHRYVFPMALVVGFIVLTGSYFLLYHIFQIQGVVSIIIELFGGISFLIILLKKGSL